MAESKRFRCESSVRVDQLIVNQLRRPHGVRYVTVHPSKSRRASLIEYRRITIYDFDGCDRIDAIALVHVAFARWRARNAFSSPERQRAYMRQWIEYTAAVRPRLEPLKDAEREVSDLMRALQAERRLHLFTFTDALRVIRPRGIRDVRVRLSKRRRASKIDLVSRTITIYAFEGADRVDARAIFIVAYARWRASQFESVSPERLRAYIRDCIKATAYVRPRLESLKDAEAEVSDLLRAKAAVQLLGTGAADPLTLEENE